MNICFVANFYKTYLFHEIAKKLEQRGFRVFWIVVNAPLNTFLRSHYATDRVLYINKRHASIDSEPVGDFRLNELVFGDRVLRHEAGWASTFLKNIQKPLLDFVRDNEIKYIFGEITWAHEILLHRILRAFPELGARYLCPHTIRIPNGRFGFFEDEFQSKLYATPQQAEVDEACVDFTVSKPDYLAINDARLHKARSLRARLDRVRRYLTRENIDSLDPTVTASRWTLFRLRAVEELNREMYRLVRTTPYGPAITSQPYVLLTLHKQPEASIDVIGRYYEDQLTNIVNVWRSLPDGWRLVVKEHTNAIGDRSIFFYRKLKRLSGVILVDEVADTYSLIRGAKGVVTVSGTAAYEAALLGIPSYTFAPCFFNCLPMCRHIDIETLRHGGLWDQISSPHVTMTNGKIFIQMNSFVGIISDPESNPQSVSDANILRLTEAFCENLL